MAARFVSEPIEPVADSFDLSNAPIGQPPLPRRFVWRGNEYEVAEVLNRRRGFSQDRTHKSSETYVHKHWFDIRTTGGEIMRIYFERQSRSRSKRASRWWLYTVSDPGETD